MTDHAAVVEHARRLLDEGATLLFQPRVGPNGVPRYSVDHRIASHSSALLDARHRPGDDFSVEMVRESAVELALNRQLVREEADEAPRVLRRGDHDRLALRVELRPPGAAEDLHHVEH